MESLLIHAEHDKIEALKTFLKSVGISYESPETNQTDVQQKQLFLNELGESVQELNSVLKGKSEARDAYKLLDEL